MISSDALLEIASQEFSISPTELPQSKHFSAEHLYQLLLKKYSVSETSLLSRIAEKTEAHHRPLDEIVFQPEFAGAFSKEAKQLHRILPVFKEGSHSCFATDSPFSPFFQSSTFVDAHPSSSFLYVTRQEFDAYMSDHERVGKRHLLDHILIGAVQKQASDVHFSAHKEGYEVKVRIEGVLFPHESVAREQKGTLINLIKVHSHMDISVFNAAQDGNLALDYDGKTYQFRVSSLPTLHGEDFVFRLFQSEMMEKPVSDLGFCAERQAMIQTMLTYENGLILCSGPTGSGKTSTLYACLRELKKQKRKNIVTLEDPIEYPISGIRQSQTNERSGHTFAKGLRAILRQDPDVILIGEIRDYDTAKIALEAAFTGHLVLTSIHTSDVNKTLLRLINFGLDPFLISHSLRGIVSQRLTPTECQECTMGCEECGYTGHGPRQLDSELLLTNPTMPLMIESRQAYSFEQCVSGHTYIPFDRLL